MPFGLGSAALAVPLTFTYTSNEVDWSQLQDWEAAYMSAASYNWNDLKPIHYAQVVVEAECEFGAAGMTCVPLTSSRWADPSYLSFGYTPYGDTGHDTAVTSTFGFTENRVRNAVFEVNALGEVTDWLFEGVEYYQTGDFRLSSAGDTWAYSGVAPDQHVLYCTVAHGVSYNWLTGLCDNGAPVADTSKLLSMGTGTWTVQSATPVVTSFDPTAVPLPAGLPMVLGGLGVLAALRWRSRSLAAI